MLRFVSGRGSYRSISQMKMTASSVRGIAAYFRNALSRSAFTIDHRFGSAKFGRYYTWQNDNISWAVDL